MFDLGKGRVVVPVVATTSNAITPYVRVEPVGAERGVEISAIRIGASPDAHEASVAADSVQRFAQEVELVVEDRIGAYLDARVGAVMAKSVAGACMFPVTSEGGRNGSQAGNSGSRSFNDAHGSLAPMIPVVSFHEGDSGFVSAVPIAAPFLLRDRVLNVLTPVLYRQ